MAKYDHINFTPPKSVREEAARGLELRSEFGRGGTSVGIARARDLSNGKEISPSTAKRMKSFFARHEVDKKAEGFSPGEDGYPSNGKIAWLLWGGDPGQSWSNKLVRQINAADEKAKERMVKKVNTYADSNRMLMRMVEMREETADDTNRSIEVVIATENPVMRYDSRRDEVISEVLRMDGIEFRTSRRQLPIVDSHDNSTVRNVLGSVRNIRVERDELVGDAMFADDQRSQEAYDKLRAGHLTDFSITATPNEIQMVRAGDKVRVRKQTIEGPAEIVTRWRPTDASLVATGADERSTVRSELRRSYDLDAMERNDMAISRERLIELGMPSDIVEAGAIEKWLADNLSSEQKQAEESSEVVAEENIEPEQVTEPAEDTPAPVAEVQPELVAAGVDDAVDRALKSERDRQREIRSICEASNISRAVADKWVDDGIDVNVARQKALQHMQDESKPVGASVEVTGSQIDRTLDAVKNGLLQRAYQASGAKSQAAEPSDFDKSSLLRMADTILRSAGINTDKMASRDIAMVAMGHQATIERQQIKRDAEAYHATGSFANLLLDAANKTLLAAYEEAPFTWNLWARQASSVQDFKNINRIRFSEAPDLEMVPENKEYKEGVMSDSKESYSVEKFGKIFSITWETIVNDDLDAISRVPAMQGNAARRTQNKKVYEVLTANENMSDGNALFSSAHGNLDASGAAPSVAELNAAYTAMMTQTGLGGEIINIEPRYIIGPPSLRGTILQLLGSFSDPSVGGDTTGNANVINIHQNALIPIIEPQLEANSQTAFYLASDPARIDTVEIAFLSGEESPVLESEYDFHKDVWCYKVRQTFGVKAIDWRGLYKNPGA